MKIFGRVPLAISITQGGLRGAGWRDFYKNIAATLTGTILAQALPLAITPILTRLYSVKAYGDYNIWMGVLSILLVIGSARLEIAIFSAKDSHERENLARLVILASSGTAVLTAIVISTLSHWLNAPTVIISFLLPLSLLVFLMSLNSLLSSLILLSRSFVKLGWVRLASAAVISISQLIGGLAGLGVKGLIMGHVLGSLISIFVTIFFAKVDVQAMMVGYNPSDLLRCLRLNWRFPVFSIPADLTSAITAQVPLLIVSSRFESEVTGHIALTFRVLSAPVGLIAAAVCDVFKESASREFREHGNCNKSYRQTFFTLLFAGAIPFLILSFFAPDLFGTIFGSHWVSAGRMAVLLMPLFFFKFIFSPLSYTCYITGRQKFDFFWQLFLLAIVMLSFSVPTSIEKCLATYSLGYSVMYVMYGIMSFRFAAGKSI